MKVLGIALIVIGLIGVVYGGIKWTTREKVIDLGSVEVTHAKQESLPLPPIVGGLFVLVGVVVLVAGSGRLRRT